MILILMLMIKDKVLSKYVYNYILELGTYISNVIERYLINSNDRVVFFL